MPKHEVEMTLPPRKIERAKIEFAVKVDGAPLGRLKLSNGTVLWVDAFDTHGYEMKWSEFAKLMIENGKHKT